MRSGVQLNISIPPELLKELETKLEGIRKPENVVKQAVNTTTRKLQREIARKVPKAYRFQGGAEEVMKASERKTATVDRPYIDLIFRGYTTEIQDFTLIPGLEKGQLLYGAVRRKSKTKLLESGASKAFVVTFRNGHTAVVYRKSEKDIDVGRARLARYTSADRKKSQTYRYNQHTATLGLYNSPSIPSMVKNEDVYGKLEEKYQGILQKNIRKVMEKVING